VRSSSTGSPGSHLACNLVWNAERRVGQGYAAFGLKQQIRNMSASGEFIRDLRRDWTNLNLDTKPPFHFLAIAGELDQFVPPESSLGPFPEPVRRVIPGDHLSMLRADSRDAPCVRILIDTLTAGAAAGRRPQRGASGGRGG